MSANISLRARFPAGQSLTLSLPPPTPFAELLSTLQVQASLPTPPTRLLLAGPPPRELVAADADPISQLLRSGDALIVETTPRNAATGIATCLRPRRGRKSMVQKAEVALKKRAEGGVGASKKRARMGSIATLGKSVGGRGVKASDVVDDGDDKGDVDWREDADSEEEEAGAVAKRARKVVVQGKGRGRKGVTKGMGKAGEAKEGNGDWFDPLGMRAAQGDMGVALVHALTAGEGKVDAGGKALKRSFGEALRVREREAEGERRVAAYLGGWYRMEDVQGGEGFSVEFRGMEEQDWRKEEGALPVVGKEVLRGVFEEVGGGRAGGRRDCEDVACGVLEYGEDVWKEWGGGRGEGVGASGCRLGREEEEDIECQSDEK